MKILVLIMSCNNQPSLRNENAIFETFIKSYNENKDLFNHEYEFMSYRGGYSNNKLNNNVLELTSPDDISGTFNKTINAFNYVKDMKFDWLVRINTSTYINLFILDNYIDTFDNNFIYCNRVCIYYNSIKYKNEVFPRGDAYLIHKKCLTNILNFNNFTESNIYNCIDDGIDNTDDSMLGVLLSHYFNHKTHEHVKLLEYSFIPDQLSNLDSYFIKKSALVIFTRLKTCPPNVECSGYSWDDNIYRFDDVKKIKIINDYIFKYKNRLSNIIFASLDEKCYNAIINDNALWVSFNEYYNYLNDII